MGTRKPTGEIKSCFLNTLVLNVNQSRHCETFQHASDSRPNQMGSLGNFIAVLLWARTMLTYRARYSLSVTPAGQTFCFLGLIAIIGGSFLFIQLIAIRKLNVQ